MGIKDAYFCLGEKAKKEAENELFDLDEISGKKHGVETTMQRDDIGGEKGEQRWRTGALGDQWRIPRNNSAGVESQCQEAPLRGHRVETPLPSG